jgi:hypothetical protein
MKQGRGKLREALSTNHRRLTTNSLSIYFSGMSEFFPYLFRIVKLAFEYGKGSLEKSGGEYRHNMGREVGVDQWKNQRG